MKMSQARNKQTKNKNDQTDRSPTAPAMENHGVPVGEALSWLGLDNWGASRKLDVTVPGSPKQAKQTLTGMANSRHCFAGVP